MEVQVVPPVIVCRRQAVHRVAERPTGPVDPDDHAVHGWISSCVRAITREVRHRVLEEHLAGLIRPTLGPFSSIVECSQNFWTQGCHICPKTVRIDVVAPVSCAKISNRNIIDCWILITFLSVRSVHEICKVVYGASDHMWRVAMSPSSTSISIDR